MAARTATELRRPRRVPRSCCGHGAAPPYGDSLALRTLRTLESSHGAEQRANADTATGGGGPIVRARRMGAGVGCGRAAGAARLGLRCATSTAVASAGDGDGGAARGGAGAADANGLSIAAAAEAIAASVAARCAPASARSLCRGARPPPGGALTARGARTGASGGRPARLSEGGGRKGGGAARRGVVTGDGSRVAAGGAGAGARRSTHCSGLLMKSSSGCCWGADVGPAWSWPRSGDLHDVLNVCFEIDFENSANLKRSRRHVCMVLGGNTIRPVYKAHTGTMPHIQRMRCRACDAAQTQNASAPSAPLPPAIALGRALNRHLLHAAYAALAGGRLCVLSATVRDPSVHLAAPSLVVVAPGGGCEGGRACMHDRHSKVAHHGRRRVREAQGERGGSESQGRVSHASLPGSLCRATVQRAGRRTCRQWSGGTVQCQ
jgi:hypothetical protein